MYTSCLLYTSDTIYYEETMLQGMIIGLAKMELEEQMKYVTMFIPRIDLSLIHIWVGLQSECKIMWNLNPRYNETEFIHKCHIDHSPVSYTHLDVYKRQVCSHAVHSSEIASDVYRRPRIA